MEDYKDIEDDTDPAWRADTLSEEEAALAIPFEEWIKVLATSTVTRYQMRHRGKDFYAYVTVEGADLPVIFKVKTP